MGEEVRYDGGHKRDAFLMGTVTPFVEWVSVCPEAESGMGVPRPAVRLESPSRGEGAGAGPRMVDPKSGADHTAAMNKYSTRRVAALAKENLDGYVLKKDSPSCGLERVRIHNSSGMPERKGVGLFAAELLARLPLLPVEDEGRLNDPGIRENFFTRVFAYRRLKAALHARWSVGDLVRFHTAEKCLLLAHDPQAYRELGRLVAGAKALPRAELAELYPAAFMKALRKMATPRKHQNVLQHMQGHFSDQLTADERAELSSLIEDYGNRLVPLIAPVTLIRHFVRRFDVQYLAGQSYLEPSPKELMLRNHA
jgi:uncharacterized protein YbgA (DUF1722 family)/uncharacterized protein YbbK (DUF523 family)